MEADVRNRRIISFLRLFVPFFQWLPELKNAATLRADILAGVTVALVLIPQSMAYAQLAGLPPYFGLYAAFLPPIVAAVFGSSRQLATGPVAMVSLLTAAALEPLATAGGDAYIAYAILLALFVGIFQMALGLLRLGVILNFLSHPVVLGFTNAAAIIIATSQLGKIFGVSVDKTSHHYETVWNTLVAASTETHWPTLAMAVLAFAIMIIMRRINPKLPNVLIAVATTIAISWLIGFEQAATAKPEQIQHALTRQMVQHVSTLKPDAMALEKDINEADASLQQLVQKQGRYHEQTLKAAQGLTALQLQLERRQQTAKADLKKLKTLRLKHVAGAGDAPDGYYLMGQVPAGAKVDGPLWRLTGVRDDGTAVLHAGGRVVSVIPQGLPAFKTPRISWDVTAQLFVSAIVIALIGFMEAISIAKAMAARTRQRLDVNQELVGQGLGNIVGSLFQSYPVSGSFSRSAVNIAAGGMTAFSSVITSLVVVITLLWLTPLLYHLPQATLAAVIMIAVIGLVNIRALKRTWGVQRNDGIVAVTTFVLTLAFAPHLEYAILIGVILSLVLYLYRTMRPRVAELSRHTDGSLRDAAVYGMKTCDNISVIRFEGTLYFANISYFEDKVMQIMSHKPELRYVIVDGVSINQIDSSGVELLESMTERLHDGGVEMFFTRVKKQVMDVLKQSGFVEHVGSERFFRKNELALHAIWESMGGDHAADCPLNIVCPIEKPE